MAIALTLQQYLADNGIDYDTVTHPYTTSATKTAQESHVSGERIAKAVLLRESKDFILAVLPASHHIRFEDLRDWLDDDIDLATEEEVSKLFPDCELGAIPPVGYGLDVVIDESLTLDDDIYFEGGDHATLVHVDANAFDKMMETAKRGQFSRHDA